MSGIGDPAPCICHIGGTCDLNCPLRLNSKPRGEPRAANPALVRTREFVPTEKQRALISGIYVGIGATCDTAEEGIAVLVLALSELLAQSARPENIPEAVETAIECLRFNTGMKDATT